MWKPKTDQPQKSASLARKGAIPAVLLAALGSYFATDTLAKFEGNVLGVYADNLAGGIPTYCAGRTDWKAPVGDKLTSDECRVVNSVTIVEYGYAVLACTTWSNLSGYRLVALTMFAINVGKDGACGSRAVRLINAGQIEAGCRALANGPDGKPVWSYAGGKYVPGLYSRRLSEVQICLREGAPV